MRHKLDPLDLYARLRSALPNAIFRLLLPWIVPTRYGKTLRRFGEISRSLVAGPIPGDAARPRLLPCMSPLLAPELQLDERTIHLLGDRL